MGAVCLQQHAYSPLFTFKNSNTTNRDYTRENNTFKTSPEHPCVSKWQTFIVQPLYRLSSAKCGTKNVFDHTVSSTFF